MSALKSRTELTVSGMQQCLVQEKSVHQLQFPVLVTLGSGNIEVEDKTSAECKVNATLYVFIPACLSIQCMAKYRVIAAAIHVSQKHAI